MRKFLKIAGVILGVILLIVICFVSYVYGIPKYQTEKVELKVEVTPERVANGDRIASMLCVQCHSNEKGVLTGKLLKDIPKEFGEIYSKNLTHDPEIGIGNWTDGTNYVLAAYRYKTGWTISPSVYAKVSFSFR